MPGAEPVVTQAPEETERLAAELAEGLAPGDVVLLSGELGSGKTTFVRGACRALGVAGRVTSPTFTLARRYEDGRAPVSHLDLHRLSGPSDDGGLLEEDLGQDRIVFVEWPEQGLGWIDPERVAARVRFEHLADGRRAVTIERRAP